MIVMSGCSYSKINTDFLRLDSNKNEYRVFPLDVKKVKGHEEGLEDKQQE